MDISSDLLVWPQLAGASQLLPILLDHKIWCQILVPRFQDSANLRLVGDWRAFQLGRQPGCVVELPQHSPHCAVGHPVRQCRQDRLSEHFGILSNPLALGEWDGFPNLVWIAKE
jgi:hypothetical protein